MSNRNYAPAVKLEERNWKMEVEVVVAVAARIEMLMEMVVKRKVSEKQELQLVMDKTTTTTLKGLILEEKKMEERRSEDALRKVRQTTMEGRRKKTMELKGYDL